MPTSRQIALLAGLASAVIGTAGNAAAQPARSPDVVAVGKLERTAAGAAAPCTLKISSVDKKPPSVSLKAGDTMAIVGERAKSCTATGDVRVSGSLVSLGKQVTVEGLDIRPVQSPAPTAATLVMAGGLNREVLARRLDTAQVVVLGEVMEIRDLPQNLAGGVRRKISEHDPQYKLAVVKVVDRVKGDAPATVSVKFASSRDIAFRDAPKFHVGQTSTLLLNAAEVGGPITNVPTQKLYVAPSRADVLPADATQNLKQMLSHNQ